MAILAPPLTSDDASKAMLDGLTSRIRDELRKRVMERLEPDIEAALDAALQAFKIAIEGYHEPAHMRDTIHVLIEKRNSPDRTGNTPPS